MEHLPEGGEKFCNKCGMPKPLSEFYRQDGMRDGHRNECKPCMNAIHRQWYRKNRVRAIENVQRWREQNPDRYKEYQRRYREEHGEEKRRRDREGHLRRKYGVNQNMFEALVSAQLGNCAICGANEDLKLHVDHDHKTRNIRGLLCGKCNKAIGLLNDDPELLLSAQRYLERADRFWNRPSREKEPSS